MTVSQSEALDAALGQIDQAFGRGGKREYPADAIFVVIRSTGEYSDREETAIVAFRIETEAKQFVDEASGQAREATLRYPVDYTTFDDDPAMDGRRSIMVLDPDGADEYDEPTYHFTAVRLLASVDTLPEGGDAQLGSVRSKGSAVAKPDAQTPFTSS